MKNIIVLIIVLACTTLSTANEQPKEKKKQLKEEVVVTADLHKQETFETSTPVSSISYEKLNEKNPQNLNTLLNTVPGVTTSSTGNGSVRPVVRGLYDERVLTLLNGIRLAEQFGGGNHSYSIEPLMLSKVEIVRGPSSVIYGTDAIGGVLNFFTKGFGFENRSDNELLFAYNSGNNGFAESGYYEKNFNNTNYFINFTNKDYGNIETPTGELKNSAITGISLNTGINYKKDNSFISLNHYAMEGDIGIPVNPNAVDMGFKNNKYKRTQITYNLYDISQIVKGLQVSAAIQYKHRNMYIETPYNENYNSTYQIVLNKSSKNFKTHSHLLLGNNLITAGLDYFEETAYSYCFKGTKQLINNITNKEKVTGVIPLSSREGFGFFVQTETNLTCNLLTKAGIRWDKVNAEAPYSPDFEYSGVSHSDKGLSGSIGFVYNITNNFVVFNNFGTAFRAPSLLERFFYGIHQSSIDIGNPYLHFERGKNIDLGFRVRQNFWDFRVSLFENKISNYISSTFTGNIDEETGLEIYTWENLNNVKLTGYEIEAVLLINNNLAFNSSISAVNGKNTDTNRYLSEIPPVKINNRLTVSNIMLKNSITLKGGLNVLTMLKQNKTGAFEQPTPGYTVFNLFSETKYKQMTFSVQINNLTNKSYHNHLSRIRFTKEGMKRSINFNLKWNF
jgi:outer membrane receptor protein involved in Fe transport